MSSLTKEALMIKKIVVGSCILCSWCIAACDTDVRQEIARVVVASLQMAGWYQPERTQQFTHSHRALQATLGEQLPVDLIRIIDDYYIEEAYIKINEAAYF